MEVQIAARWYAWILNSSKAHRQAMGNFLTSKFATF
jgi:hypothetical protein